MTSEKLLIGWKERIDFPKWKLFGVRAKVDTGARSSCIHVEDVLLLVDGRVSFRLPLDVARVVKRRRITAKVSRLCHVKSSHGDSFPRIFVKAEIRLGDEIKKIELNLVNRSKMSYPMLLGRSALGSNYLIDIAHQFLLKKTRKKAVDGKSKSEKPEKSE